MRLFILVCTVLFSACQVSSPESIHASDAQATNKELINIESDFSAHWLKANSIVLAKVKPNHTYYLTTYAKPESQPAQIIKLETAESNSWIVDKYPHLKNYHEFKIQLSNDKAKTLLKNMPFVVEKNANNVVTKIAYAQTGFLLDELYTRGANDADETSDLGASIKNDGVHFKLWAPTVKNAKVLLFNKDKSPHATAFIPMHEDTSTGIWHAQGASTLKSNYYKYELTLYHYASKQLETLTVTDPYSLSLSTNSKFSQIVDLKHPDTQPSTWANHSIPTIAQAEDNIFYELHIRDFSSTDTKISNAEARGKYKAFSENNSAGIQHLKQLKNSGLNNIHLLPTFDIGTINEDRHQRISLSDTLNIACNKKPNMRLCQVDINKAKTLWELLDSFSSDSEAAQGLIDDIRSHDNYNWGYDPYHYTVPEGSYAIDPEGKARIIEFREMIQSLHNMGFRVIMDVVYNHTHQAGLKEKSVLDKIVPNYYHRLHPISGAIERSTCCDNTATERAMMAKLMTDSLVVWAREYKIDGFRFDLMGHQPKELMLKAREAVRSVDPDTYFYGEGWNFGEVANNQRFVQATQIEMSGSEIGTFSDRLRDAVRGCCFNSEGNAIRNNQGIGNGLGVFPNEMQAKDKPVSDYALLLDQLRISLAGNLADFPLINATGKLVTGKDILYGNQASAYAKDPADTINYVSKHDNQTLWDNNQYRNAYTLSAEQRVRMHTQNLSYVLLAQGIPFIHMGSELLRSKSFLRDSYDYGDWFNQVDFTKQKNNYNIGLPPADKDKKNWPLIKDVLAQNQGREHVNPEHIMFASDVFNDWLKIRTSTKQFRLTSASEIITRVKFHNTGIKQKKGLIVMSIDSGQAPYKSIVVIFNFGFNTKVIPFSDASDYELHPVQQHSVDDIVKTSEINHGSFVVPALTTAVFIRK